MKCEVAIQIDTYNHHYFSLFFYIITNLYSISYVPIDHENRSRAIDSFSIVVH